MKTSTGSWKKRLILTLPVWLVLLVSFSYTYWLSDVFISFGLEPMKTYYLFLVMMITFMIGYFAGELRAFLQAKLK
ncbi:hypothetical protein [Paenibacillus sp. GCM10028914]|uniref:hypothetical protein n=1 Tax=Paenibacillus sp. GCM10028914 TaxID=3273416 RepID=UPI0036151BDB